MTDHSRQDRTRSPRPNRKAQLYRRRDELDAAGRKLLKAVRANNADRRKVQRLIDKAEGANGDGA